jgi:excisionase family DNA binding protein
MAKEAIEKRLPDILFTAEETARILKSNTNTIYKLIREGKLQALKLGRLKVPMFAIENFLQENLGKDLSDYVC